VTRTSAATVAAVAGLALLAAGCGSSAGGGPSSGPINFNPMSLRVRSQLASAHRLASLLRKSASMFAKMFGPSLPLVRQGVDGGGTPARPTE